MFNNGNDKINDFKMSTPNVRLVSSGKYKVYKYVVVLKVSNSCLNCFKLQFFKNKVLYFCSPYHTRNK